MRKRKPLHPGMLVTPLWETRAYKEKGDNPRHIGEDADRGITVSTSETYLVLYVEETTNKVCLLRDGTFCWQWANNFAPPP